jgi:hypothetical protein
MVTSRSDKVSEVGFRLCLEITFCPTGIVAYNEEENMLEVLKKIILFV